MKCSSNLYPNLIKQVHVIEWYAAIQNDIRKKNAFDKMKGLEIKFRKLEIDGSIFDLLRSIYKEIKNTDNILFKTKF